MKLPHTEVKFYPEVKSQTGLSSLWVSCKRALKEGIEFGEHPIVTKMLKRIFRTRLALPRYICIYGAETVIEFLKSLPSWEEITLKWLTLKLVTLLALSRCQTLNSLSIEHMDINIQQVTFYIPKVIKNTTTMFHPKPIILQAFPADERISPVRKIVEYIKALEKFRKSKNLLLSYYKTWAHINTNNK